MHISNKTAVKYIIVIFGIQYGGSVHIPLFQYRIDNWNCLGGIGIFGGKFVIGVKMELI